MAEKAVETRRKEKENLEKQRRVVITCQLLELNINIHVVETETKPIKQLSRFFYVNTFAASYLNTQGLNNSCLKSPASALVDLTFQSRALRSFSLNQLRNLSL